MLTYKGAPFYSGIWRAPSSQKCKAFLRWALRYFENSKNEKEKAAYPAAFSFRGGYLFYCIQNGVLFLLRKGCLRLLGEVSRRREVKGGVLLTSPIVYPENMDKL